MDSRSASIPPTIRPYRAAATKGALVDGAHAGIASRIDALEAELDEAAEAES